MPAAENNNKFWNLARKTEGLIRAFKAPPSHWAHLIVLGKRIDEVRAGSFAYQPLESLPKRRFVLNPIYEYSLETPQYRSDAASLLLVSRAIALSHAVRRCHLPYDRAYIPSLPDQPESRASRNR